jgi:hypothetical protein
VSTQLTHLTREVGSTCQPTSFKNEDEEGTKTKSYNVLMLKSGKTLGDCFPGIKVGPKRK